MDAPEGELRVKEKRQFPLVDELLQEIRRRSDSIPLQEEGLAKGENEDQLRKRAFGLISRGIIKSIEADGYPEDQTYLLDSIAKLMQNPPEGRLGEFAIKRFTDSFFSEVPRRDKLRALQSAVLIFDVVETEGGQALERGEINDETKARLQGRLTLIEEIFNHWEDLGEHWGIPEDLREALDSFGNDYTKALDTICCFIFKAKQAGIGLTNRSLLYFSRLGFYLDSSEPGEEGRLISAFSNVESGWSEYKRVLKALIARAIEPQENEQFQDEIDRMVRAIQGKRKTNK